MAEQQQQNSTSTSSRHCVLFGAFADDPCCSGKRVTIPDPSLAPLLFGGALPPSTLEHDHRLPPPPFRVAAAASVGADGCALASDGDGGGLWQCRAGQAWSRVQVPGMPSEEERFSAVAIGDTRCLALLEQDGSVVEWRRWRQGAEAEEEDDDDDGTPDGFGACCVLGPRLASTDDRDLALRRLPIASIAAGRRHFVAVARSKGGAAISGNPCWAWGESSRGQCGVAPGQGGGKSGSRVPRPRLVEALGGIDCVMCAAGDAHSLVASADAVFSFGGGRAEPALVPERDLPLGDDGESTVVVVQLAAGGKHSVALTSDGRVHVWGVGEEDQEEGAEGALAWGQRPPTPTQQQKVEAVVAGWRHTVLVLAPSQTRSTQQQL